MDSIQKSHIIEFARPRISLALDKGEERREWNDRNAWAGELLKLSDFLGYAREDLPLDVENTYKGEFMRKTT